MTYHGGVVVLRWSASNAKRCIIHASPRFWSGPNPARVHCRGRFVAKLPAVDLGGRWKFTLTARNGKRKPSVAKRTFALIAPPFKISLNWAGYVVPSSAPVTAVSGQFTVPTLNCAKTTDAGMSTWVGIGGAGGTSGDLLQTGVRSDCQGGTQYDDVGWWEEAPEYPEIDFTGVNVSPGNLMRATVSQNADLSWTTRIDDLTTGISGLMTTGQAYGTVLDTNPTTWLDQEGSTANVSYSGGHTAEWIVEDYLYNQALVPLADFGTVTFTGVTTSLPSWTLTNSEQSGIGDRTGLLHAAPSAPDSSGHGFSVYWTG
jgi:Peptidase A4 family